MHCLPALSSHSCKGFTDFGHRCIKQVCTCQAWVRAQVIAAWLRVGKFIRLVPQPVMLGFVNGLALIVANSQLKEFKTESGLWLPPDQMLTMLCLTGASMAIIFGWEKWGRALPAPLLSVGILTAVTTGFDIDCSRVGDLAAISGGLPSFHVPNVPVAVNTVKLIVPTAVSLAATGLIQSLLTQQLVDELADMRTSTHVECRGQGLANVRKRNSNAQHEASHRDAHLLCFALQRSRAAPVHVQHCHSRVKALIRDRCGVQLRGKLNTEG